MLKLPHSHNYVPVNSCGAQICDDDAFLAKSDSNSCRICHSLATTKGDVLNISIVQQCLELEMLFGTKVLEHCLAAPA